MNTNNFAEGFEAEGYEVTGGVPTIGVGGKGERGATCPTRGHIHWPPSPIFRPSS